MTRALAKRRFAVALFLCLVARGVHAQYLGIFAAPNVGDTPVRISEHVWGVYGFPNIGIVVGTKAVLVVDTGLGPHNGSAVARLAQQLAPHRKLYLTTTHFHPEHASGDAGFPKTAVLIRNRVQQQELERTGQEMIRLFASRSDAQMQLLADVELRRPDILFDREYHLDLGGIVAHLLWFGGAHTRGDEMVFVDPDRTLISGDVVQNKVAPNITWDGGTLTSWMEVLRKTLLLHAEHVLPDHSVAADGAVVALDLKFISELNGRALELKGEGLPSDAAGEKLTAEFKQRYGDWSINNLTNLVKRIYAE